MLNTCTLQRVVYVMAVFRPEGSALRLKYNKHYTQNLENLYTKSVLKYNDIFLTNKHNI